MRTSCCILAFLLVFLTCSTRVPTNPSQVLAEFDIFSDGDQLLLPVEFDGKEQLFILDTGASMTFYDSAFYQQLGEALGIVKARTEQGFVEYPWFKAPDAFVGRLSLNTRVPVLCGDLRAFRETDGHQEMGLIGCDFLRQHCIRIDFDAGKLEFLAAVEAEPGFAIPLAFVQNWSYEVKVSIAGEEERFKIDTGHSDYNSGKLEATLFERLLNERKLKKISRDQVVTAFGSKGDTIAALNDFGLGPFTHQQLYFSKGHHNVLGLRYLSRYIVTFDFPNEKMYLKKGKRFDEPDGLDQSGLHILRIDGKTIVKRVDSDSPAERAGIEPNDILLKLDNLDVEKTRMYVLREQLCHAGRTVHACLQRGEQRREFDLKLGR
jgi:hypothetical protein